MTETRPGVLMVTGAYYPELSGAGLQCRTLVTRLSDRVRFEILTTATDPQLPAEDRRDGVPVHRIHVDPKRLGSKLGAAWRMARTFRALAPRIAIVHLHGFSQKSVLLTVMAILSGKKIAIKLTSFGDDDPRTMMRRSRLAAWCYRRANMFFAVTPKFRESYDGAGLPGDRFRVISNGVDLDRFRPPADGERSSLRRELKIPDGTPVVLFVGFFSVEKQPHVLFEAWHDMAARTKSPAVLVFIGATGATYHEIDAALAPAIRRDAAAKGVTDRVVFVESTLEIERYYRAADIFVLPSLREGMPNALLEAMASGMACVTTRLEGITDRLIADGESGLLVPPGDRSALADALTTLATDSARRDRFGRAARRTIETQFSLDETARQYLDSYQALLAPCAA